MDKKSKILLVEDNFYIRDIYSIVLKEAGYQLETADEGNAALEKVKSFQPDIILLDIMIPGRSGLEILKLIRSQPEYKAEHTKVMILTNFIQDEATQQAIDNHADDYIIKADINPTDLVKRIEDLEAAG